MHSQEGALVAILALLSLFSGVDATYREGSQILNPHGRPGKHSFPSVNERDEQLANEFQLIKPKNIRNKLGLTSYHYTVTEISPLMINNDDVVTVSYSTDNAVSSDWIAAYSPADADITQVVPVKYGWCNEDDNYMSAGYGSLYFNMTNLRSDIKFYYFSNGLTYPNLVATYDQNVDFNNYNEPLKPRVVPTGDYNVMKLVWSSKTSAQPTLKWGTTSGGEYTNVVQAVTDQITIDEVCGAPANATGWFDTGLIHIALLEGMEALANQQIYYIFGDEDTNDYSKEYRFFVPPLPGTQPPDRGTTVVLYDDLGRGSTDDTYTWYEYGRPAVYTMYSVAAEIDAGRVDAIYHGGDISYATGYLSVWDFFLDMISPAAASVPYLTTGINNRTFEIILR